MRVESLTVKMLRSGRSYTNDTVELRVALDDGENWREIERQLRAEAEEQLAAHWRYVENIERVAREERIAEVEEERRAREEAREKEEKDRAAYLATASDEPCDSCPVNNPSVGGGWNCINCPAAEAPF